MACSCEKKCPDRVTMRANHGNPEAFGESLQRAWADLFITMDEMAAANARYRSEYESAPETSGGMG